MYSYDKLIEKIGIDNNSENRKYLKSIVNALVKNNDAKIERQLIYVDYKKVEYLYGLMSELNSFFDYTYNTKLDLTKFLYYLLNKKETNINAIFCPGYTSDGYKDYIGNNNTTRMKMLSELSDDLRKKDFLVNFRIILANIFLENTDDIVNPNWKEELLVHEDKFVECANKVFDKEKIIKMSSIYPGEEYIRGFVDSKVCHGSVYEKFYKNNIDFYKRMNWNDEQIKYRNDRLFTIYNIISKYIMNQENGVYVPMETMYSRSKIMTNNGVCTMYLVKK